MKKLFFSFSFLGMLFFACQKDALTTFDCTGQTPTYSADIKPIFDAKCATSGCHSATKKESGYDLSSYSGAKTAGAKAALLGSMEHLSQYKSMPQGGAKLPDSDLQKISCWIDNGMPN